MKKLLVLLIILSLPSFAATKRSAKARYQFRKSHPCPATGKTRGACKGYVIDHVKALCVGGSDSPDNMAWQTVADAKAKDKWECKKSLIFPPTIDFTTKPGDYYTISTFGNPRPKPGMIAR